MRSRPCLVFGGAQGKQAETTSRSLHLPALPTGTDMPPHGRDPPPPSPQTRVPHPWSRTAIIIPTQQHTARPADFFSLSCIKSLRAGSPDPLHVGDRPRRGGSCRRSPARKRSRVRASVGVHGEGRSSWLQCRCDVGRTCFTRHSPSDLARSRSAEEAAVRVPMHFIEDRADSTRLRQGQVRMPLQIGPAPEEAPRVS